MAGKGISALSKHGVFAITLEGAINSDSGKAMSTQQSLKQLPLAGESSWQQLSGFSRIDDSHGDKHISTASVVPNRPEAMAITVSAILANCIYQQ